MKYHNFLNINNSSVIALKILRGFIGCVWVVDLRGKKMVRKLERNKIMTERKQNNVLVLPMKFKRKIQKYVFCSRDVRRKVNIIVILLIFLNN